MVALEIGVVLQWPWGGAVLAGEDGHSAGDKGRTVFAAPDGVLGEGEGARCAFEDLVGEAESGGGLFLAVRVVLGRAVAGRVDVEDDPAVRGPGAADAQGNDLLAVDGPVASFDLKSGIVVDTMSEHEASLLVDGDLLGLVGGRADDGGIAVNDLAAVRAEPGAAGARLGEAAQGEGLGDPGVARGLTELR
ncbi:hypothetical protein ACFVFH_19515 [Streptomyces sp. NPDC057697]|uniref:hypothetical protein n=1 Tax=Streptomyces sp. NPDC057697 TaxID=3346219 RepID=UPI00367D425C